MDHLFRKKLYITLIIAAIASFSCNRKTATSLPERLKNRDVELVTTKGTIRLRLYDDTPLHRDNFLLLTWGNFYNGILFHRVIQGFMIQAGDPSTKESDTREKASAERARSKTADSSAAEKTKPGYTIPAEIRPDYFHRKGVLAAARTGDKVNPQRASSGSQFYIVQGKTFTDASLDSVETHRLNGRKIPEDHRAVYKTIGGAPHLDQAYTIFGEVISGLEVIDSIAAVKTSARGDRPLQPVRILKARLVNRK